MEINDLVEELRGYGVYIPVGKQNYADTLDKLANLLETQQKRIEELEGTLELPKPDLRGKLIALLKSNQNILSAAGISASATLRLADHLIAHGVTVQRWISVQERLPEAGIDVLALLQCGDCVVSSWSGTVWRARWTNTQLDRNPTHWMPLPEPPKEATHG